MMHFEMMCSYKTFLLCILGLHGLLAEGEDKWIWSKDRKTGMASQLQNAKISMAKPVVANDNDLQSAATKLKPNNIDRILKDLEEDDDDDNRQRYVYDPKKSRYDVNERIQESGINGQQIYKRPNSFSLSSTPPPYKFRPSPTPYPYEENLPLSSGDNSVNRDVIPPPPPPASGPGGAIGILTGPIPSWEKPVVHKNGDPTSFDTCKCSFSFNCKSPGIKFGTCDRGKEYCCYNEELPEQADGGAVDRYDGAASVLIGPRGPKGILKPPIGSSYHPENSQPFPSPDTLQPLAPFHPLSQTPTSTPPRKDILSVTQSPQSYHDIINRYGADKFDNIDRHDMEYDKESRPTFLPQKPVLPPYIGLHNDYRSS